MIIDGTNGLTFNNSTVQASAGQVLQVVNATYSTETNNSGAYADTGLTATITPKFSTSKILVLVSQNGCQKQTNNTFMDLRLLRSGTSISEFGGQGGSNSSSTANNFGGISLCYLDSPATTSATIYKTQFKSEASVASVRVQNNGAMSTITLIEVAG